MRAKPYRADAPIALPERLEPGGQDPEPHRARVAALAERHRLDLSTAYSVLAGVVTLDEALRCRDRDPEPGDRSPRPPIYDRAFSPAVEDGHLSIQEAVERGRRSVFAAILARRFRLPLSLALLVADKRLRLPEAIDLADRRESKIAGAATRASLRLSAGQRGVVLLLAGAIAAGLAIRFGAQWDASVERGRVLERAASVAPAAPRRTAPPRPEPAVEVRRDLQGRVNRVAAATPEAVLEALCAASGVPCEVVAAAPATGPFWNRRLGLVRFEEPVGVRAVTLVLDDARRRWVAGDGVEPLRVIAPPVNLAGIGR